MYCILCIHVTLLTVEILARQATFNFAFAWYLTFFFLLYSYFASCLKVMLCTVPCTVKYIQLKDYFVTWSIRFVCHYRLTTDKWKLTSCGFQVLTFLHGVGGGECGDLALRLAHSYAVGRDWSKNLFFFFMIFCNLAPSWTSRASGKDKCAGNDTGEVTVTLLLLHSSGGASGWSAGPVYIIASVWYFLTTWQLDSVHFLNCLWSSAIWQFRKQKILST